MAITNGYATLAQVKAALRITDAVDDALLEISINGASRQIDAYCERVFYATTGTRLYTPQSSFYVEIDDLSTITKLETNSRGDGFDVTWAATDYQLEPLNQLAGGMFQPATRIRAIKDFLFPVFDDAEATVRVTGTFGYAAIPADVQIACILLSERLFKRFDSPGGVMGFSDIGAIRVSRNDPDVAALLDPYIRVKMA
jgi:hypothetical protein